MYYWPLALIMRTNSREFIMVYKVCQLFFIPFHMKIVACMYERLTSFRFVSFVTLWWKDHLVCRLIFISNIYRFINKMWFMIWNPDQAQYVLGKGKTEQKKRRIFQSLLNPKPPQRWLEAISIPGQPSSAASIFLVWLRTSKYLSFMKI